MTDLAAWLLAQIADDEAAARAAIAERSRVTPDAPVPDMTFKAWPDLSIPAVVVGPERVLAECAAKKAIVELHTDDGGAHECVGTDPGWGSVTDYVIECRTLLLLAQPYADRPGFDPAWKVP